VLIITNNTLEDCMKSLIATAACALALGFAAAPAAQAAPMSGATGAGIERTAGVEEVRHHRRHWKGRHWKHRHWGKRRCWRDCTGIGPLRVCKTKCRY